MVSCRGEVGRRVSERLRAARGPKGGGGTDLVSDGGDQGAVPVLRRRRHPHSRGCAVDAGVEPR